MVPSIARTVANSPFGDLQSAIGRSKLDAVTDGEDSMLGTKDFDTGGTRRVVLDPSIFIGADGDSVVFAVDSFDRCVIPSRETEFLAAAPVQNDIADFVVSGVGTLRFGEITIDQDDLFLSLYGT